MDKDGIAVIAAHGETQPLQTVRAGALPPLTAAERMRAHRQRRRDGLRCLTIELRDSEIDALVRKQLLKPEVRNDSRAIIDALYVFLDHTL